MPESVPRLTEELRIVPIWANSTRRNRCFRRTTYLRHRLREISTVNSTMWVSGGRSSIERVEAGCSLAPEDGQCADGRSDAVGEDEQPACELTNLSVGTQHWHVRS